MEKKMTETNPEEIHRLFEEYFNSGDLNSLVDLYEDDAAFVPEPGQVLTGKDAIREALQGFLSLNGKMQLKTRYAVRSGEIALLSGEWQLSGGKGQDGQPVEMSGKTAEVARRQADGRWLYVADHPFGAE
jgi:uncharacterized protein (TIGR02246 family)